MRNGTPYELPDSWTGTSIGTVVVKTKGRDPTKAPDEEFHYVDVSSVSNESFRIVSTTPTVGRAAPSRARKEIRHGDVLFATVRPTLRRIALVPDELDGEIASTGYCVLRSDRAEDHSGVSLLLPYYGSFQLPNGGFGTRRELSGRQRR